MDFDGLGVEIYERLQCRGKANLPRIRTFLTGTNDEVELQCRGKANLPRIGHDGEAEAAMTALQCRGKANLPRIGEVPGADGERQSASM